MARVKRGVAAHQRHKKWIALAKGHRATNGTLFRRAHESLLHSLSYSYAHRRKRKGDMRRLWIVRINAASRAQGMTYGQLMNSLKGLRVEIDRKMLAEMAVNEPTAFANLVTMAKTKVAA